MSVESEMNVVMLSLVVQKSPEKLVVSREQ